jgi:hypothetical protein
MKVAWTLYIDLSWDWGRAKLAENLRVSPFKEGLPIVTTVLPAESTSFLHSLIQRITDIGQPSMYVYETRYSTYGLVCVPSTVYSSLRLSFRYT